MYFKVSIQLLTSAILVLILPSCGKSWLEAKPDKSLVVPTSVEDLQALLDNSTQIFNVNQSSGLGEIAAGDFYITDNSWQSLFNVQEKSAYIWEHTGDFYKGESSIDWSNAYRRILNANVVLDGIEKMTPTANDRQSRSNVKGSALFFRAFDFFNLAQEYCRPYTTANSDVELGLPLRIDYDVNIQLERSSLRQTYDQILSDLKIAVRLLGTDPAYKTRPSRQAAYALLARTHLAMESYSQAGLYADSALQIQSDLLDYEKLNSAAAAPFARFNEEVIFHSTFTYGIFSTSRLIVLPELYDAYAIEDARRFLFFAANANGVTFKGHYSGDKNLFGGLATDELYLIRAECSARNGNLTSALNDLNKLLKSRWKGGYVDFVSNNQVAVLDLALSERRKQLAFRGIRWTDLRRLNRDSRYAITLSRTLNDHTYILVPNDKRYVFPIDEQELALSGISQNDR